MALVQSRSLPACPRKWARPSELWALCRNCSRHHTKARLMPQTCRSLLLCSGWIQCSIRSGMIRASKNSARIRRSDSHAVRHRPSRSRMKGVRCNEVMGNHRRSPQQSRLELGLRQRVFLVRKGHAALINVVSFSSTGATKRFPRLRIALESFLIDGRHDPRIPRHLIDAFWTLYDSRRIVIESLNDREMLQLRTTRLS